MKSRRLLELLVAGVAVLTLVMLISSFTGAASNQNTSSVLSIGYVDMSKIQNELPDVQKFQTWVKDKDTEFKMYQSSIYAQHRNTLKELEDKANKEKAGKSTEEQAAISNRYNEEVKKKAEELNSQLEKKRTEIMQFLNEQRKVTDEKVRNLISAVAAEKKLSIVLDKSTVFYGGIDITDSVIEKGKKQAETSNKNKK